METVVRGVTKTFERRTILAGVDMELQTGAINVIIGPNGAGKTTLLRIIGLLEKPDNGLLQFSGQSVNALSAKQKTVMRRKIGFVFQHPLVLEGSVLGNMTYGMRVRKKNIDRDVIETMLQKVGLQDKINQDAKKLSGGEKQRLQLARVMLLEPELYLLDEPTANLDPLSTRSIETLIKEIVHGGKTVLFSTHNLVQARLLGHKFFYMSHGRVIHQGTGAEIFHQPISLDMAEFASSENILHGEIITVKEGESDVQYLQVNGLRIRVVTSLTFGPAAGVIRAEDILISTQPIISSARNSFIGKIDLIEDMGIILSVAVVCQNQVLISFITRESANLMDLRPGKEVYVTFKSTAVHVIKL
ncbi:MAG: ABC transporter ATP-binding protein [Acidobacteria bacterium]|jgi:molybdopterin-binding protein|nr:ABC transporter ATP-binding protein [Acidobacteriota bacterium]